MIPLAPHGPFHDGTSGDGDLHWIGYLQSSHLGGTLGRRTGQNLVLREVAEGSIGARAMSWNYICFAWLGRSGECSIPCFAITWAL